MKSLAVIVPTNHPYAFFECMNDSIKHLAPLRRFVRVAFCFCFQSPWTEQKIGIARKSVEDAGFDFLFVLLPAQEAPASMFMLRNEAARLAPDADYYLFADDNMMFVPKGTTKYPGGSAARYLDCIEYMDEIPECGAVMCEGSLGGDVQKRQIRPTTSGLISTTRGLFFRNLHNGDLYLPKEVALRGGFEELMLAYRYFSMGMFTAKQFNNPTRHLNKTRVHDNVYRGHITDYEIIRENAELAIRSTYDDPTWTLDSRRMPRRLLEMYREAGGAPDAFQTSCSMCGGAVRSEKFWRDYPTRKDI